MATDIQDTPQLPQSPFTDSEPGSPDPQVNGEARKSAGALSTVMEIEEATRRASKVPEGGLARRERNRSPFGDENAVER